MSTSLSCAQERAPSNVARKRKLSEQAAKESIAPEIDLLPSPRSEQDIYTSKRQRVEKPDQSGHVELPAQTDRRARSTTPIESSATQYGSPVCWEEYFDQWPRVLPELTAEMSDNRAIKRSHTPSGSNSYSQSVRDGDSPAAWTKKHEEKMLEAGLVMSEYQTQATMTDDCRQLCDRIRMAEYPLPDEPSFKRDRLMQVLERVQTRNEARVARDLTPIVVPSPELLHIDGHASLDDVCEATNAEWIKCNTLCGPKPKPDFVAGISAAAFTDEEKEKLRLIHTSACPNLFPENMYFPFLICEVKSSSRPLREAELQTMHAASIALNAVIELFRKVSATAEVDRTVLAFSVAHDHSTAKIFGHFATIEGGTPRFYRRRLHTTDFAVDLDSNQWARAYKITRAIYADFSHQHLARIKSAISRLRTSSLASFTTQFDLNEDSQSSTPGQSSSQDGGQFKKPALPSTAKLQQENDRLRDKLLEMLRDQQAEASRQREDQWQQKAMMERQIAQQKEQMQLVQQKEQMEKQLVQQKEQMEKQLVQQKEQMEKQLVQQKEQMEKQLVQQKEQMEKQLAQQKEEAQEQKAMMKRQLVQQEEIVALLKESKSK